MASNNPQNILKMYEGSEDAYEKLFFLSPKISCQSQELM